MMPNDPPAAPEPFAALEQRLRAPAAFAEALRWVLGHSATTSGSIHRLGEDGLLHLVVQVGLPPEMLDIIRAIPLGKGMAGLAAERRAPVTLCNLQTDTSGQARPGARATGLRGSIALPITNADGTLVGVLGVGRPEEHTFDDAELAFLEGCAARIARRLAEMPAPRREP